MASERAASQTSPQGSKYESNTRTFFWLSLFSALLQRDDRRPFSNVAILPDDRIFAVQSREVMATYDVNVGLIESAAAGRRLLHYLSW